MKNWKDAANHKFDSHSTLDFEFNSGDRKKEIFSQLKCSIDINKSNISNNNEDNDNNDINNNNDDNNNNNNYYDKTKSKFCSEKMQTWCSKG